MIMKRGNDSYNNDDQVVDNIINIDLAYIISSYDHEKRK